MNNAYHKISPWPSHNELIKVVVIAVTATLLNGVVKAQTRVGIQKTYGYAEAAHSASAIVPTWWDLSDGWGDDAEDYGSGETQASTSSIDSFAQALQYDPYFALAEAGGAQLASVRLSEGAAFHQLTQHAYCVAECEENAWANGSYGETSFTRSKGNWTLSPPSGGWQGQTPWIRATINLSVVSGGIAVSGRVTVDATDIVYQYWPQWDGWSVSGTLSDLDGTYSIDEWFDGKVVTLVSYSYVNSAQIGSDVRHYSANLGAYVSNGGYEYSEDNAETTVRVDAWLGGD